MEDSIDDLLAQIKAQYADADANPKDVNQSAQPGAVSSSEPKSAQPPSTSQPAELPVSKSVSPGSIDNLLAEIGGKPAPPRQGKLSPPLPGKNQQNWQPQSVSGEEISGTSVKPNASVQSSASTDRLLDELKTQYDEHDRAEALKQQAQRQAEERQRQEHLRQEQRQQAELKRQKQLAAMQQAEEWLKRLDPRSGEAVWFEEFAAKYESRLEAAIDYLGLC